MGPLGEKESFSFFFFFCLWKVGTEAYANSASFWLNKKKKKGDYMFSLGCFAFIHQIRSAIFPENIGFTWARTKADQLGLKIHLQWGVCVWGGREY